MLDELKAIGCDTARSVLQLTSSELVRRTDLEEETIGEILKILRAEFDEEDFSTKKKDPEADETEAASAAEETKPKKKRAVKAKEESSEAETAEKEEVPEFIEKKIKSA